VPKRLAPIFALAMILVLAGCSPEPPFTGTPVKPDHTGRTGCALVSTAEVNQISGVTFGTGVETGPIAVHNKGTPDMTTSESCEYKNGDNTYVEYFLDTIDQPAAAYEQKVWSDDKTEEPNSDYVALGGQPAFRMVEAGQDGQNFVEFIFYRGDIVVQINTSGVPNGTAEQVAALVAKRM
jgi:hypothetical protein